MCLWRQRPQEQCPCSHRASILLWETMHKDSQGCKQLRGMKKQGNRKGYFGCASLRKPLWRGDSWAEARLKEKTQEGGKVPPERRVFQAIGKEPWGNTNLPFLPSAFLFILITAFCLSKGSDTTRMSLFVLNSKIKIIRLFQYSRSFKGDCFPKHYCASQFVFFKGRAYNLMLCQIC